jgi:hypothetical protein
VWQKIPENKIDLSLRVPYSEDADKIERKFFFVSCQ